MSSLIYKIATEPWEFELIHRLNYQTFVEEIPQHTPNPEGRLVDKFHEQNTYVICLEGEQLLGMVALRGERPFSLDAKLENLDSYLPEGRRICEIRLLAIAPSRRQARVLGGIMERGAEYIFTHDYDLAIISGTTRQLKLYRRFGFEPFGPLVGTGEALYQPMYMKRETMYRSVPWLVEKAREQVPVNLLPGPVAIHPEVRAAFNDLPISHRADRFVAAVQESKRLLCDLVGARHVEMLVGSGTLANDAIAAQLSLHSGPGLLLSNGEFGERLVDQATRTRLDFEVLRVGWGEPFDYEDIERTLAARPETRWLWYVLCETSTSVLNDAARLTQIAQRFGLDLCVDAISAIGTVPVDLSQIYLASGVSGKGLAAYPGLGLVFYNHPIAPQPQTLPRYLDLGYYAQNDGVPFTSPTNLLYALRASLQRLDPEPRFAELQRLAAWLQAELRARDFHLVAPDEHSSPAVITIALPEAIRSQWVGDQLEAHGYLVSYKSGYLLARNWIQICLMGACAQMDIAPLLELLTELATAKALHA